MNESDHYESLNGKPAVRGKLVILTAIAFQVALVSVVLTNRPVQSQGGWVWVAFLLCGVHLYLGASWARWIVGIGLAISGLLWAYGVLSSGGQQPILRVVILMVLAAGDLVIATQLMFSSAVRSFAARQSAKSNVVAKRILQAVWLVLFLSVVLRAVLEVL